MIDDLGFITNLQSGKTYTYIYFVSILSFPGELLRRKKNHSLKPKQFLQNIIQVAVAFINSFQLKKSLYSCG